MSDDGRDREGTALAILGGVFGALLVVLVALLLTRDGGDTGAASSTTAAPATTAAPSTTAAPTTEATAPPTTPAPATTAAPATTTTVPPTTTTTFGGDTDWKNCTASGPPADRVADVRFAQREGFTRVVFDLEGGVPACTVGYADPTTLVVILYPIDDSDPFAPGIFDAGGNLEVGTAGVVRVNSGGMGGGSMEWEFSIQVAGTRDFQVLTLEDPSRVAIDIEG